MACLETVNMNFKAGVNFEMLSVASLPSDFQELCREVSTQLAFNFASRSLARSVRYWRVAGGRPCLLIWDTELKGQGGATRAQVPIPKGKLHSYGRKHTGRSLDVHAKLFTGLQSPHRPLTPVWP